MILRDGRIRKNITINKVKARQFKAKSAAQGKLSRMLEVFLRNVGSSGVILLATQTMHCYVEIPQIYHVFASSLIMFDPPKMGL